MIYHTPEPWVISEQPRGNKSGMVEIPAKIADEAGTTLIAEVIGGIGFAEQDANAKRIVACVNALKGYNPKFVRKAIELLETIDSDADEAAEEHSDKEGMQITDKFLIAIKDTLIALKRDHP